MQPNTSDVNSDYWFKIVRQHLHCPNLRCFRALFGVEPKICSYILLKYTVNLEKPLHLLWALNFLKEYSLVHCTAAYWNVSTSTFGNAVWKVIEKLSITMQDEVINFIFLHSIM